MHKKGRSRREMFDIIYEILTILTDSSMHKTMLAHKTRLDSRTTNKYVNLLQRANLIAVEDGKSSEGRYMLRITEKGREFLNMYSEITRLLGSC